MGIIATPLGWIMKGCYFVCKNYGIALLLFTILTRLIVFPLNVKQQKSMARMTMLQPELEKIKKKYAKNQQKMQEEQMNLYAKAGVNPYGKLFANGHHNGHSVCSYPCYLRTSYLRFKRR